MSPSTVRVTLTGGESFEVPFGVTVLSAAQKAGVIIPYSCQSGTCRTCMSRVISGEIVHDPEYEDELLIDPDDVALGFRLLCSSFAWSDSVIEIGG